MQGKIGQIIADKVNSTAASGSMFNFLTPFLRNKCCIESRPMAAPRIEQPTTNNYQFFIDFCLKVGRITTLYSRSAVGKINQKRRGVRAKIQKSKIFFISFHISIYKFIPSQKHPNFAPNAQPPPILEASVRA